MTFTPVQLTDGENTRTASSPSELSQALWEGWVTIGGTPPPIYSGAVPSASDNLSGFLDLLAATFVAKRDLVISPIRPATAPDGTVHIKNAT